MRSPTLRFLGAVVLFGVLWLCLRFPFQVEGVLEKVVRGPDVVDPLTLHLQGEFVESNLGSALEADGSVTVRLIAEQFNFVPRCLLVPAGTPVRFRVTSADAVHMFTVSSTEDGIKAVPGRVNEARFQFSAPGEYKSPCHEFCGAGHYDMRARLMVVARDQFPKLKPDERVNCVSP